MWPASCLARSLLVGLRSMSAGMDENALWLSNVSPEELRRIINVLYRVHRFISVITDLDTLLEQVMEESKEVADAEACSLMLYDPKQDELYFHVALGESGDQQALKREIRLSLGTRHCGRRRRFAAFRQCPGCAHGPTVLPVRRRSDAVREPLDSCRTLARP